MKIKKLVPLLLIVLCVISSPASAKEKKADFLFAQTALGGHFDGKTLKLTHSSKTTLYFSERPKRLVGHLLTEDFFKMWGAGKDSFSKVPPNAVVSVVVGKKVIDTIVELTSPRLSGNSLSYGVKILKGALPRNFDYASIFIDGSPSIAMGNLYQATSQALSNAAHNATTAQQNANTILQATTTQGVALQYGVDTSSTAVGISQIMADQ